MILKLLLVQVQLVHAATDLTGVQPCRAECRSLSIFTMHSYMVNSPLMLIFSPARERCHAQETQSAVYMLLSPRIVHQS